MTVIVFNQCFLTVANKWLLIKTLWEKMSTKPGFAIFMNSVVIKYSYGDRHPPFYSTKSDVTGCTGGDSLKLWNSFMRDSQNVLSIGLSMLWIIWLSNWNLIEIWQDPHWLPANTNKSAPTLYDLDMSFAYQWFKITKSLQD